MVSARRLIFAALWLGVLALTWTPGARGASISAWAEPSVVIVGQSFHLHFDADSDRVGDPDLSPIEEQFRIIGQSSSRTASQWSAARSVVISWELELMPTRAGEFVIPPIAFGSVRSDPVKVLVRAQGAPGTHVPARFFIEATVDETTPYVQQQVVYTVRVFSSVRAGGSRLGQPVAEGVDTLSQALSPGGSAHSSTVVDGRRYNVFEQRHAFFPQASGTLRVPALSYDARVREHGGSGETTTRFIRARSDAIELDVRDAPQNAPAPWLPARLVTVSESWDPDGPVSVGDTVTRRIVVRAVGLTAAQLPELVPELPDGIRRYPEPPGLEDVSVADGVTGTRVQTSTIVATRPGTYTLAGHTLDWWNVDTDRAEQAVLPSRTLVVSGAPAAAGAAPAAVDRDTGGVDVGGDAARWRWLSGGLALAWLVTAWRWRVDRRRDAAGGPPARRAGRPGPGPALSALGRACAGNDARAARDALLTWSDAMWPESPPANLTQLTRRCDTLAPALDELQRALYAPGAGTWDGSRLWALVRRVQPRPAPVPPAGDGLEPLYRARQRGAGEG